MQPAQWLRNEAQNQERCNRYDIPNLRLIAENAFIAKQRSSAVWEAQICTRMRALSFGTTGYENTTT